MQLTKFGLTLLTMSLLSSCSLWPKVQEPRVITVTNTVKTLVPPVVRPKPVQLNDVKIYVVTKDNFEEFAAEFTKKNGELVYISISIKDYENLSLNIAELRRFINQQNQIIIYYEEATKP
jgi:hypothetical protein